MGVVRYHARERVSPPKNVTGLSDQRALETAETSFLRCSFDEDGWESGRKHKWGVHTRVAVSLAGFWDGEVLIGFVRRVGRSVTA